jgi:hypothetical protein
MKNVMSKILVEVKKNDNLVFYLMIGDGVWHRRGDQLAGDKYSALVISEDQSCILFNCAYQAFKPSLARRANKTRRPAPYGARLTRASGAPGPLSHAFVRKAQTR